MECVLLDRIPFQIDLKALKEKLRVREQSSDLGVLQQMAEEAQAVGKPRALYRISFIESKEDDAVVIDGTKLTSRVLRVNLEQAYRAFPFVATCGTELEKWANPMKDLLERYWAETIKEMALKQAMRALEEHLVEHYQLGTISRMSPGSLKDWPIEEQQPLFQILGNTDDTIGVHLTDSLLMIPTKSISGIQFPTEGRFESCQLCPREGCPGRRASYDKDLYDKKYRPL